jgi:hypothetical protein
MTTTYATVRARTRRVREEGERGREAETQPNVRGVQFSLGRLYATPGALSLLGEIQDAGKPYSVQRAKEFDDPMSLVLPYVRRHASGDWGDVSAEDRRANEDALTTGARLFSAYQLPAGRRLWIITEADRSVTTVLRPEEY